MNTTAVVQQAINFIEDNLQDQVMLEEIADSAAISLSHLYRLFYAVTGHPIVAGLPSIFEMKAKL